MDNPVVYIVLNGELNMSPGKAAAQAVQASKMISGDHFTDSYKRTVIVLEAKNGEQIRNLHEYLKTADIYSKYYIDEGKNEVDAYSITALAVYPISHDDTPKREIFEDFPLFPRRDEYDEDDYSEPSNVAVRDELRGIRNSLNQNFQETVGIKEMLSKPKWYKRLFNRKKIEYVS